MPTDLNRPRAGSSATALSWRTTFHVPSCLPFSAGASPSASIVLRKWKQSEQSFLILGTRVGFPPSPTWATAHPSRPPGVPTAPHPSSRPRGTLHLAERSQDVRRHPFPPFPCVCPRVSKSHSSSFPRSPHSFELTAWVWAWPSCSHPDPSEVPVPTWWGSSDHGLHPLAVLDPNHS